MTDTAYRTITYRLIPGTQEKAEALSRLAGACRYVWNELLDKDCTSNNDLFNAFSKLRAETPWLRELPSHPLRYALKYQADAWSAYFRGDSGKPRHKGRHGDDSVTLPDKIRIRGGKLLVPKTGWYVIRRKGDDPYEGCEPVRVTIKRSVGKWYATVIYKVDAEVEDNGLAVGVDMNVGQVAASTGDILHAPDTERLEAKARRYQRQWMRREKGSNRRGVSYSKYAKVSRRLGKIKDNWRHHISRVLADTAGLVAVEDLKTKAMTAKGKRGLNREVRKTGWGTLRRMIEYKAAEVIAVRPHHTSQTCHECGAVDPANRKSQAVFECVQCGHRANADVNAALNVLALGTEATGRRGAFALATPMNRQRMLACTA